MKKIYSFVLLAVTLLLSTSTMAETSGKVFWDKGDDTPVTTATTATDIAKAISDWAKDGGTLTIGEKTTYDAAQTVTIAKDATLNLNGNTLNWNTSVQYAIDVNNGVNFSIKGDDVNKGTLSFVCSNSSKASYAIFAANKGTTKSTFSIKNVNIIADFPAYISGGYVVGASTSGVATSYDIENVDIVVKNYIKNVFQCGKVSDGMSTFTNVSIVYSTEGEHKGDAYNFAAIVAQHPCVYENLIINLSKITQKCCAIQPLSTAMQTIRGDKTAITLNKTTSSRVFDGSGTSVAFTLNIESGVFVAPAMVKMDGMNAGGGKTIKINGGTFSATWPYNVITPNNKILQKNADGNYTLTEGIYKFAIIGQESTNGDKLSSSYAPGYLEGFLDLASCLDKCSSDSKVRTYVQILTIDDFEIPENKYVRLSKTTDEASVGVITNNGNVTLSSAVWNNKIINNGTLSLGTAKYGDDFVLENNSNAENVTVKDAMFTEKALEQVKNYVPQGLVATLQADGYYKLIASDNIVATVGVYGYDNLSNALKVSTKDTYAKLCKNYIVKSKVSIPKTSENEHCYLDLNGYDIIGDDADCLNNEGNGFLCDMSQTRLTISGTGTIQAKGKKFKEGTVMFSFDGMYKDEADYCVLEIGKDVAIYNENFGYIFGVFGVNNSDHIDELKYANGVRIDFAGKAKSTRHFIATDGSITNTKGNVPVVNILPTADITCGGFGAYASGYAKWNIAGKIVADSCGIEMRAGELTMTGGSIEATMKAPADDQFNGNGSTSQACAISAMQHSTKLPISITINGGELKAYTPIYQANPQKNSEDDIKKVSVVVNNTENSIGPKIYSTSNNIVWSANKVVTLNGGVYNLNPAAYVANDKAVVDNTDETTKTTYPYAIGTKADNATTLKDGNWNDAATWSTNAVPTTATPVVVKHAVTILKDVKAQTYGIDVQGGTIAIEGALAIGNGGIKGIETADHLLIKDGAAMVISPAATENNHPLATVYKAMNIKHKDAGTYIEGVESPYLREHIGLPTIGKHTTTSDVQLLGRQWNTSIGWEDASEFATAFKGYSITSEKAPEAPVAFAGQLVGNQDAVISMSRGFHFVGNSWVAPINTTEILNQVGKLKNENAAEAAIKVYLPSQAKFEDINLAKLKVKPYKAQWGSLASMQAFFLYANRAATITLSYEQAVWNALLAQQPKTAAKRVAAEDEEVSIRINLTAKNGRTDYVYVYEGEEFRSTKMMNEAPNVNIYVETETGNYSTFGTVDLEGITLKIQTNGETEYTLSFEWIEGETLAIKDLETGAVTAMTEGNTYTFTATANTTTRRFMITRKDIPSSVETVTANSGTKGVYSITGQFLGEDVNLNTLPQGIYVVDGQKYIK